MMLERMGFTLVLLILSAVAAPHSLSDPPPAFTEVPQLAKGFDLMYEQRFGEARAQFADWERQHPDEPFVHAGVAATYLFEEFYRQGVLTSEFFLDDKKFLGGIDGKPDPVRLRGFRRRSPKPASWRET